MLMRKLREQLCSHWECIELRSWPCKCRRFLRGSCESCVTRREYAKTFRPLIRSPTHKFPPCTYEITRVLELSRDHVAGNYRELRHLRNAADWNLTMEGNDIRVLSSARSKDSACGGGDKHDEIIRYRNRYNARGLWGCVDSTRVTVVVEITRGT